MFSVSLCFSFIFFKYYANLAPETSYFTSTFFFLQSIQHHSKTHVDYDVLGIIIYFEEKTTQVRVDGMREI